MSSKELGVGLVGAGLIGALHSFSLKTAAERAGLPVRFAHVADLEEGRAKNFKNNFGYEKASGDPEALIRDRAVDAVYICAWTSEHSALAQAAFDEKKHVFCEKPLAFNARQASRMLEAAVAAGVIHQVGLVLRQGPVWNVLRDEVRTRDTGFPISLIFRDDQCFPIKGAHPSAWRKDPEKAGHGTLIEHSIHDLDLLEWIFGPVSSVHAKTACRFGHDDIEDLARVDLEFESGMAGTLVSVWHDVLNRHSNRRLEVFHEKVFHALECEYTGSIQVMAGGGKMKSISRDEVNLRFWELRGIEDPVERELSVMLGVYEDYLFCRSILEGTPPGPGFEVAVRAHELVDACYRSAETGDAIGTL
jgi:myo-inositol 2-dehydrogenase/D-chiro-inositol 1-dehydrogenase